MPRARPTARRQRAGRRHLGAESSNRVRGRVAKIGRFPQGLVKPRKGARARIQFRRGAGHAARGGSRTGPRRTDRLARQRHVGHGGQPPQQGLRRRRRRRPKQLLRELLAVPAGYQVLFLQGGATAQFAAIPLNLARADSSVDYVNTGAWSKKAIGEAQRLLAKVNVAADEAASRYTTVPPRTALRLTRGAAYLHYTPNETIGGVEFPYVPDSAGVPLVADMSSTHPVAADRGRPLRPDLRRRAEEHRSGGPGRGDRARGSDRARARRHAGRVGLQGDGRRGLDAQHAADLRLVPRRPGASSGSRRRAAWRRWRSATAPRRSCCTAPSTSPASTQSGRPRAAARG